MASQIELNTSFILIFGTVGMLSLTTAITIFIYLYQRKLIKRKIQYQQMENLLKREELRSTYSLLEGQDEERQRIAEELHNNLGSILVTLNMFADTLVRSNREEEMHSLAQRISDFAQKASEETRAISHKLDTTSIRYFGLQSAILNLIEAINNTGVVHIETQIQLEGEVNNLTSFNLYRIIQELINNTFKHAKASKIQIHITQVNKEYISFIYEDNGVGFSADESMMKGLGMRNMVLRVEKLKGQISFGKKSDKGSSVSIEIPLNNENDQDINRR